MEAGCPVRHQLYAGRVGEEPVPGPLTGKMGKIYYILGPSASGKDTIYRRLLQEAPTLGTMIPYTTRPMRDGEEEGREYFFTDEENLEKLRKADRVIEERCYATQYGPWYYFTVDDGRVDLQERSYLCIGTLESFQKVRDRFGKDRVLPLYIDLDAGERLQRALTRERMQEKPGYEEMCRRFLADSRDFSEEKIREAGICRRFINDELDRCIREIREYMGQTQQEKGR